MDYNALYWKSKSVKRNAENKELKKRIKELKSSRESWKSKYKQKSEEVLLCKNEINNIKKKLKKILY
jgi:molecular chaperone GrpE (heat shock protein)